VKNRLISPHSHFFKSQNDIQISSTNTHHQLTKPQTSQIALRTKDQNEGGPFSNLRSISLVCNDQERYEYYSNSPRICTRTFLKYPCCGVRIDDYKDTKCVNAHLFDTSGHIKEEYKVMDFKCHKCLHAKPAKEGENMSALHTAVDKSTTHPLPTKKVRWEEASK
jgi:hypothetical protein